MAFSHFRMLLHELLNKNPAIVTEEDPLIVLDSKSAMCMAKNGKNTKYTRHISRGMNFITNGERFKMQKIDWCGGGLKLANVATKNIDDPDLTPRMKYNIVILDK